MSDILYRPSARIEMNGKDVTAKWSDYLESISVTDEAGIRADSCEIAFDNKDRFSAPPIGAEIKVWLGYQPQPVYRGRFKVTSWSKSATPRRLVLAALSADFTSEIRTPKMRSHHQLTVRQIVELIAGLHGLTAVVDAKIGARMVEHIDQQRESDVAFLTRLAKRQGATFKIADGKLLFAAKGSLKRPSSLEKTAIHLPEERVTSWEANFSHRGGFKSASAHYMDHITGRRKSALAGTEHPRHRDRRLYGSKAEASAAAHANLGDLTRGKMTVSIEMPGDPRLYPEALVRLENFDGDVDGEYLAKRVTHAFGRGGYSMNLALEDLGGTADTPSTEVDDEE